MMTPYETAKQKARYGHNDWIVWRDKHGVSKSAKLTPETMKECLLDVGTQRKWSLVCASGHGTLRGFWKMGINILNQFKHGGRYN